MNKDYIRKFRKVIRIFEREVYLQNTDSCCNGVTLAQCHTLMEIEKSRNISVTDLANSMSLDKSTVSRTVDGLVNIGLIKRIIPAENRRMAIVSLTKTGQETCNLIHSMNDKYIEDNLSILSEKEQKDLLKLFTKLTDHMVLLRKRKSSTVPCGQTEKNT